MIYEIVGKIDKFREDIYGWDLTYWLGHILFDQVRRGLGHEVGKALRRAPTTLSMNALDNIHVRVHPSIRLVDANWMEQGWR